MDTKDLRRVRNNFPARICVDSIVDLLLETFQGSGYSCDFIN